MLNIVLRGDGGPLGLIYILAGEKRREGNGREGKGGEKKRREENMIWYEMR